MADYGDLKNTEHVTAPDGPEQVSGTTVKVPLDKVVALRLNAADWTKLEEEARELGVGPTTLVRMWILERLRQPSASSRDTLGAIELFLQQAFREGILLRASMEERVERRGLRDSILLQTPREQPGERSAQGAIFFGNMVIN